MNETYATTNYLYWLNPEIDKEKRERQEAIHRRMSQMLIESYQKQLKIHRDEWWEEFNNDTRI